jgi:MoaA/NifB/PqqE/SkfB family radical SAM enzyme
MDLGPFDQRLKAFAHRPQLLAIARGEFLPPVSVKIELTNACNHDCHFCAYRRIVQEPKPKDMLAAERVTELVDELARGGVRALMFTGGGEPLLHPACERIFARCRERGMEHALITNGTRLGRLSDEAVAGMRWIRFSINAGSAVEYARVHGANESDWDKAWSGVARAADKARFDGVTVGVSFVVTTWQASESLRAWVVRARELGADYVHIRPAFEGPHTLMDRQLGPEERRARTEEIEALAAFETPTFRVHGVKRRFDEIDSSARTHTHCRTTPLVSYVLPTGDVSICTIVRDRAFNPAVPDPFLGNIYRARFFELWGADKHRTLIRELSHSGCGRCHFAEYNRALADAEHDLHHTNFL